MVERPARSSLDLGLGYVHDMLLWTDEVGLRIVVFVVHTIVSRDDGARTA